MKYERYIFIVFCVILCGVFAYFVHINLLNKPNETTNSSKKHHNNNNNSADGSKKPKHLNYSIPTIPVNDLIAQYLEFPLFYNQSDRYKCPKEKKHKKHKQINKLDRHFRGTSLGGWLIIEPWITPSLFYQFLGASETWKDAAKDHIAIDPLTFCKALGPEEANRQLRIHWKSWVTEDDIAQLAKTKINTLRIPVADWMYLPYEPYYGCWDGALEELDRVLDLCEKYNLNVLLDLHALKGSQNGLDNSGDTGHYKWIGNYSTSGGAVYSHWEMRGGEWAGSYDPKTGSYVSIDEENILQSVRVIQEIIVKHQNRSIIVGLQPANEPSQNIPFQVLQEYYWRSYQLVQLQVPDWTLLFHDSFRLSPEYWGGDFLKHCDNYAVDSHLYLAWDENHPIDIFIQKACDYGNHLSDMEALGVPVVVGEWSLATDNCAMWINGLNDNVPSFPKVECTRVKCPDPYFDKGLIPNAPPDPSKGKQDPFGTGGDSYVLYGTCPIDRTYEGDMEDIQRLSYASLNSFDLTTHGFFFWNFKTELESRWSYLQAVENKWIPTSWKEKTLNKIQDACPARNISQYLTSSYDLDHLYAWKNTSYLNKLLIGLSMFFCGFILLAILQLTKRLESKANNESSFEPRTLLVHERISPSFSFSRFYSRHSYHRIPDQIS